MIQCCPAPVGFWRADHPPCTLTEHNGACFIVRDATGQALAYLYFRGRARSALGGQAAQQGRGAADGGELRQAAGDAAPSGSEAFVLTGRTQPPRQ